MLHKLRETGDWKAHLHEPGFEGELCRWFEESAPPIKSHKKKLCISVVAWGDEFRDRLVNICLQSMRLQDLDREVFIMLHTDKGVHVDGFEILNCIIPQELLCQAQGDNKYWLMGANQSIHLMWAKRYNASIHFTCPDHLYSRNYFKNLLRLADAGHKIIAQTTFSGDIDYMRNMTNSSSGELMRVAIEHPHPQFAAEEFKTHEWMPNSHRIHWIDGDTYYTRSPHMQLSYLDLSVIENLPDKLFTSHDSELEKIIPEGSLFYVPSAEDDLLVMELSKATDHPACGRIEPLHHDALILPHQRCFYECITSYPIERKTA